jgi:non-ribosomal peptide synthetase component F
MPAHRAVICNGAEWTYQQLNEYSNRAARHLRRQGLREGSVVAVCLERSREMLGAVLAVLKAGAAYLPLDPTHPAERIESILADAEVAVLLTEEQVAARLHTGSRVICLDT